MKKMFFAALLITMICNATIAREVIASGKTYTSLGDYRIEISDNPATLNGEVLKTYVISYQNSPATVKIVIRKDKDCKNYIVLSDKLSVQYVCNGDYFGVQKLDKSLEAEGYKTSDAALNRSEYFHQKLIAQGKQPELEAAKLIAVYFPLLIKDEFIATN